MLTRFTVVFVALAAAGCRDGTPAKRDAGAPDVSVRDAVVPDAVPAPVRELAARFDGPALDPGWRPIEAGDAKVQRTVDGRLGLSIDAMGTRATPLKVVGVRSAAPLAVGEALEVVWGLDWNAQANGSYLKAAVYLAPRATDGDPEALPDWIRVSYVGVPPGETFRHEVAERRRGQLRFIDRGGWPKKRTGRAPAPLRGALSVRRDGTLEYREDGSPRAAGKATPWKWTRVWVYVTSSSHSNYPKRTIYVDDIEVRAR